MNTKELKEQRALEYLKEQVKKGIHPSYGELHRRFNIGNHGIKLDNLYPKIGITCLELKCKRPNSSLPQLKRLLVEYIQGQHQKGIYPTRTFLEKHFRVSLNGLFNGIDDLYNQAGIKYIPKISQHLKNTKACLLQRIIVDLLPTMGLTLVQERGIHEHGIDLITRYKDGSPVGIEIKAHSCYEPIKKRNIIQLERFLTQEKIDFLILVTTTSQINAVSKDKRIKIISFDDLIKICNGEQVKTIEWIRNEVVHQENKEKAVVKENILKYARERLEKGENISCLDITKKFRVDVRTYFNGLNEIYDTLHIFPPIRKMESGRRSCNINLAYREEITRRMVNYIKEEAAKRRYPTGVDVGNKFGLSHIWNFVTMTELYQRAGLKPYLERRREGKYNKKIKQPDFITESPPVVAQEHVVQSSP